MRVVAGGGRDHFAGYAYIKAASLTIQRKVRRQRVCDSIAIPYDGMGKWHRGNRQASGHLL